MFVNPLSTAGIIHLECKVEECNVLANKMSDTSTCLESFLTVGLFVFSGFYDRCYSCADQCYTDDTHHF